MSKRHPRRSNLHHRCQRKDGGSNDESNLVKVDAKLHQFYHAFFREGTYPPDMARTLNDWIRPDWCLIAVPKDDIRKVRNYLSQLTH